LLDRPRFEPRGTRRRIAGDRSHRGCAAVEGGEDASRAQAPAGRLTRRAGRPASAGHDDNVAYSNVSGNGGVNERESGHATDDSRWVSLGRCRQPVGANQRTLIRSCCVRRARGRLTVGAMNPRPGGRRALPAGRPGNASPRAPGSRLLVVLLLGPVPGQARSRRPAHRSYRGCPRWVVWLSFGLRGSGVTGQGEVQERFALLEAALPSRLDNRLDRAKGGRRWAVSWSGWIHTSAQQTIEVMDAEETVLGGGRYGAPRPPATRR